MGLGMRGPPDQASPLVFPVRASAGAPARAANVKRGKKESDDDYEGSNERSSKASKQEKKK